MKQSKRVRYKVEGVQINEMRDYERNLLVLTPAFLEKVSLNILKPLEMRWTKLNKKCVLIPWLYYLLLK